MDPDASTTASVSDARVPTGVVIASICGVWLCYFVLASLRGVLVGLDFNWAYLSRRLIVTVASIALTGALWPLLRTLDARPLWVRTTAVLIGALPAALLLSAINQLVFADMSTSADPNGGGSATSQARSETTRTLTVQGRQGGTNVRIHRDDEGNMLVDVAPPPPAPPPPPSLTAPRIRQLDDQTVTIRSSTPRASTGQATLATEGGVAGSSQGRLEVLTDFALGRYYLLLAWAALYLALLAAEQARAAERREGEYRRAAEASELRSLRYQVNPHFLFNTLNSLSAQVMTGRLDDAERMIQTLSNFYRRTLSGDPTGDLTLASEVELQQLYLDIEAVRFPTRLARVIDLPQRLGAAMVPGMILQPLVENSVKYAVAASSGAVTITIAAHEDAGNLVLTIADSGGTDLGSTDAGGGMKPRSGTGIGLANVRDRLDARFGGAARLDAGPAPGGGYRTVITMPLVLGPATFDDTVSEQAAPDRAARPA